MPLHSKLHIIHQKTTYCVQQHTLSQNVGLFNRCADLNGVDNPGRCTLLQLVVWNLHRLIFHIQVLVGARYYHSYFFPTKSRRTLHRYIQGPKNISHANCFFCCYPPCAEIWRLDGRLDGALTFSIPTYRWEPTKHMTPETNRHVTWSWEWSESNCNILIRGFPFISGSPS